MFSCDGMSDHEFVTFCLENLTMNFQSTSPTVIFSLSTDNGLHRHMYPKTTDKIKSRPHPRDYSTQGQTPWLDDYSSLLFATLGKTEPLIPTAAHQKFDLYLIPLTLTLSIDLDLKAR